MLVCLNVLMLCILCILCFVACKSDKNPVSDAYTGEYHNSVYGTVTVTSTDVSSSSLLLPSAKIGNNEVQNGVLVWWDGVPFNYNSDKTFSFTAYVESSANNGNCNFAGTIVGKDMSIGCPGHPNVPKTLVRK